MLHVWLAYSRQRTALFGNNSTFTQLLILHKRNITKWFLRVCFQIEFPSHVPISVISHGWAPSSTLFALSLLEELITIARICLPGTQSLHRGNVIGRSSHVVTGNFPHNTFFSPAAWLVLSAIWVEIGITNGTKSPDQVCVSMYDVHKCRISFIQAKLVRHKIET